MPDEGEGRCKGAFVVGERDVELLEEAAHRRRPGEDQLRRSDHDRLVTVADVVGVIGPLLRRLRMDDVDGFGCFSNFNDRSRVG